MFKNLSKFNVQRNFKEAIGFFLAYFLFGLLLASLCGGIAGSIYIDNAFNAGKTAGLIVTSLYCIILYFIVYVKKKMNSFIFILIGPITGIIAYFIGIIIPLIVISYLTTRKGNSEEDIGL